MSKIAVPTLHSRSNPYLESPANTALYLIRFYFANPGSVSSVMNNEIISFRRTEAKYGKDKNKLAEEIGNELTAAMNRYYPDEGYIATVSVEDIEGTGTDGSLLGNYGITIAITNSDGVPVCPRSGITVAKDNGSFQINLK